MLRRCCIPVLILAVAACSPRAATQSSLLTDRQSYEQGETVIITLRNTFSERIGYNLCLVTLQLRARGEWQTTPHLGENEACTMELRTMPAGSSAEGQLTLPRDLEPGTYRITHEVEIGDERRNVISESFEVHD